MNGIVLDQVPRRMRRGIELGFYRGKPLIYDGTEPVAIDAQAGKGTRSIAVFQTMTR
ncbi:MAG: hypothetical protein J0I23_28840 [Rhizobiales bacterium]|nr:hypothetical protein [Hyphomicrobiales bacterium]